MRKLVGRSSGLEEKWWGLGGWGGCPLSLHSKCVSVDVHKGRVSGAQWHRRTNNNTTQVLIASSQSSGRSPCRLADERQQHPGWDALLHICARPSRLCVSGGAPARRACHTLPSAPVGRRDFLNRAEFLTWKLALNPICTGRHIFGQSCATADRENEPSILYNVASLLSYLPPANFKLSEILLP